MTWLYPLLFVLAMAFPQPDPAEHIVEPADLMKDVNLVGREVVVDDRVRYFQPGKGGKGQVLEEVVLKRTSVIFRLPPGLRPEHPPRQPAIRLTGLLQKEGGQFYVDVTSLEMMPSDLDRLDREVRRLSPNDAVGRAHWASWAERRAKDFKDAELATRGRAIETEGVLIEAERPKPHDMALARRARERNLGDDVASALAHRYFRARLATAKSAGELEKLAVEVQSFLPKSSEPRRPVRLGDWSAKAKSNPLSAYRDAPEEIRAALDRALFADVVERNLELRVTENPDSALDLAEEAKTKLPDRPELAQKLRGTGLSANESRLTSMRLSEVEELAKSFREDGQPDRARKVCKEWLGDQRKRLNASDSDGHILLADQYNRLLSDRASAADILREALKSDPQVQGATDALRRMGYRKSIENGDWYDPAAGEQPSSKQVAPAAMANRPPGSLRGMRPSQVRAQLGSKPDRIVRVATQDEAVEQWIYQGAHGTTVVNFRCPRNKTQAEVISNYSLH